MTNRNIPAAHNQHCHCTTFATRLSSFFDFVRLFHHKPTKRTAFYRLFLRFFKKLHSFCQLEKKYLLFHFFSDIILLVYCLDCLNRRCFIYGKMRSMRKGRCVRYQNEPLSQTYQQNLEAKYQNCKGYRKRYSQNYENLQQMLALN